MRVTLVLPLPSESVGCFFEVMIDCIHTIGLIDNDFDLSVFLMIDNLSELTDPYYHNDLEKLLNNGGGFRRTLTKFNYCPDCGAKIDWDKITTDLLTNKK